MNELCLVSNLTDPMLYTSCDEKHEVSYPDLPANTNVDCSHCSPNNIYMLLLLQLRIQADIWDYTGCPETVITGHVHCVL